MPPCSVDSQRTPYHVTATRSRIMPRPRIPAPTFVLLVGLFLGGGCYQDPKARLDAMEETLALQSTLEELGQRTTELQFAVDSLRGVIARQDTTLRALAGLAGVPFPR